MKKEIKKIKKYAEGGELESLDSETSLTTGDPTKPVKIPLPDYKDSKSRLSYAQAFREKYGKDSLKGYGDIPLRVNEKPMYGSKTSKELAIQEAKAVGLDPATFYASSMIEGQSGLYAGATKTADGQPAWKGNTGDKDFPISGLWGFGLDSFTDYYPTLKKKGYLPQDFDKQFKVWEGEGGPLGPDADPEIAMFKSTDAGIKAKAAMMRAFYDESDAYASKKGIKLTPEQRDFFGLAHFNSGAHGYEMMDAYNKAGLLKSNDFLNKIPNITIPGISAKLHQQIYSNISPRIAAARGLKEEGLFKYGGIMPKKMFAEGGEVKTDPTTGGEKTNPNSRDAYYESNAKLAYYKDILNQKLKAKNPEGFSNYFKGLVDLRRSGNSTGASKYVQDTPYNDYLSPEEVKTTLGSKYDDYLGSLKSVNTYNVQQGQQPLFGQTEGENDINKLNYGRRFASLQVTPSFSLTNKTRNTTYSRDYTYNPQKGTVDFSENGDLSLRPSDFSTPAMKKGGRIPEYQNGGLFDPEKPVKGKSKGKVDEGFVMPTVDGNGYILPNGDTVIGKGRIGQAPPIPSTSKIDEGFLMPGQTTFGGPVSQVDEGFIMPIEASGGDQGFVYPNGNRAKISSPFAMPPAGKIDEGFLMPGQTRFGGPVGQVDEGFAMPIIANTKQRGVMQYNKGGKVPKYQDGTEDPIKPINLKNPSNVGVNTWAAPGTDAPINPNAPSNEQIFRIPQQNGTPVDQGNIIPLAQFASGNYVNNQGQTTADASVASKQSAENLSNTLDDAEKIGSIGITAINAYFNKQDTAKRQRTDRRAAIMQQQFAPTVNPYLEGTGSQAIMKYGGGLSRGDDYGSKSKPYPSVASSDFAGGGRSYPIPTKADAEDALRLAHLHGRSDVIAKVHAKYPELKYGGAIMEYASGGSIHINPENKGKFNATKARTGKSTEELTHSKNPTTRKRAIFAQNAAKWHHKYGGEIDGGEAAGFEILDGGKSKVISTSDHSNPMVEFTGKEHTEGGIGLSYGGNVAEVENKEVGWVDQEGGLNIFGKLKLPGTNQTFRKAAEDIANQESKIDGQKSKYLNILNNGSPTDPYQETAQSTAKVMFKSLDKQSKQIAEKKEALASYQNLILAMANQNSGHMKYGGKMPRKPYAEGGTIQEDQFDFTGDPTPEDIKRIAKAIGEFESSAKYDAIGVPVTKGQYKGQRALGKYQIMEDNMRSWGKDATGRDITVAEFIADPKLQDQIAEYQMSEIAKFHPKPEDIASIWFTGRPTSNKSAGAAKDDLGTSGNQYVDSVMKLYNGLGGTTNTNTNTNANTSGFTGGPTTGNALNYTPNYKPLAGGNTNSSIETKYGKARREPAPFSDKANIGNGSRERGFISPLAIEQIAPELLTIATNKRDPVNQLTYQPDLKQTFDISYQLGRNENQSTFNQAAKIAENTGNVDALSEFAAQKYKADQAYNMQEVQGNAQQKLQTYSQNIDVLNDAKVKNLALIADQQTKTAQAKFNTRAEDLSAFKSISGKSLQNQLENKTYNAYANLFKHYGFDKKGNVTFEADKIAQRFSAGEAQQFGMMAAQQGASAIMNGDFSRKFTKVKNSDGSQTTTETLGNNKKIQEEYKTLKNQGFDDGIIGNMLRAKYPETISQD